MIKRRKWVQGLKKFLCKFAEKSKELFCNCAYHYFQLTPWCALYIIPPIHPSNPNCSTTVLHFSKIAFFFNLYRKSWKYTFGKGKIWQGLFPFSSNPWRTFYSLLLPFPWTGCRHPGKLIQRTFRLKAFSQNHSRKLHGRIHYSLKRKTHKDSPLCGWVVNVI